MFGCGLAAFCCVWSAHAELADPYADLCRKSAFSGQDRMGRIVSAFAIKTWLERHNLSRSTPPDQAPVEDDSATYNQPDI
jgi:hypothetical protein